MGAVICGNSMDFIQGQHPSGFDLPNFALSLRFIPETRNLDWGFSILICLDPANCFLTLTRFCLILYCIKCTR